MRTRQRQKVTASLTLPLLLWMLIGGIFVPRSAPSLASVASVLASANPHSSCLCRMCKGGAKACCCTPAPAKAGKSGSTRSLPCLSAGCDGADDDALGPRVPPSVLPPVASLPLPVVAAPVGVSLFVLAENLPSRLPEPLLAPPQRLS